ncbi:putative SP-containing protein [Vairimorpha necatrix]|uniref:SP-containing protein n=1 Tax=Vairimorpha necatrix TaxID=6039 RepID=A0AAX4JBQ1_9MICR
MIVLFFIVFIIKCSTNMFVIPIGKENGEVYIALNDENFPATYIISEIVDEANPDSSITSYNIISETSNYIGPYYFRFLSSLDKEVLEHFLESHKISNKEDSNLVKEFLDSKIILMAEIKLDTEKCYFIGKMHTNNLLTVDKYSTSEKLHFTRSRSMYDLQWCKFYNYLSDNASLFIPLLYKKNILILPSFVKLKEDKVISNIDTTNDSNFNEKFSLKHSSKETDVTVLYKKICELDKNEQDFDNLNAMDVEKDKNEKHNESILVRSSVISIKEGNYIEKLNGTSTGDKSVRDLDVNEYNIKNKEEHLTDKERADNDDNSNKRPKKIKDGKFFFYTT